MKLPVERLKDVAEAFHYRIRRDWWGKGFADLEASGVRLDGEPEFEVRARALGEKVYIEGEFEGFLEAECGRCTKRYRHALRDSFRLVLEPLGSDRRPADPEGMEALERSGMCLGEDLETGWYRGGEIELDALFSEVISLEIPLQPLCGEECTGLCPVCGSIRSEENCNCEDINPASPFAALASLRGKREGSS